MTTTLDERVDLEVLENLLTNFDAVAPHIGTVRNAKKDYDPLPRNEIKQLLTSMYTTHRKSFKVHYHYAKRMSSGRLFAKSPSLQNVNRIIRNTIAGDIYDDIDIVNCHPVIIEWLCHKHSIKCETLSYYNANRAECLATLQGLTDTHTPKELVLKTINWHSTYNTCSNSPKWFNDFVNECNVIREALLEIPEYSKYLKRAKHTPEKCKNAYGSAINSLVCQFENEILQTLVDQVHFMNGIVGALCFDGLMIYKNVNRNYATFLPMLEKTVLDKHHIAIKLVVKPMTERIPMNLLTVSKTDAFDMSQDAIDLSAVVEYCDGYDSTNPMPRKMVKPLVEYLNKWWAFIMSAKVMYIDEIHREGRRVDIIPRSDTNHIAAYKSISYAVSLYMGSHLKRTYESIGFNPSTELSTTTEYNVFCGFAIRAEDCPTIEDMSNDEVTESIAPVLNHIRSIWCNDNQKLYDWCLNYISWILQRPTEKTGASLTLQSDQGAGKDCITADILGRIIGKKCFIDIHSIDEFVGHFNSQLEGIRLALLNEVQFGGDVRVANALKTKCTASHIKIERKGLEPYTVANYIETISHTNGRHSSHVEYSDRRNQIISLNNKYAGRQTPESEAYFGAIRAVPLLHVATFLYRRDLTGVNLRNIIQTEALDTQKLQSLASDELFIYNTLCKGAVAWKPIFAQTHLWNEYKKFVSDDGGKYDKLVGRTTFFKHFCEIIPYTTKRAASGFHMYMPSYETACEQWTTKTNLKPLRVDAVVSDTHYDDDPELLGHDDY